MKQRSAIQYMWVACFQLKICRGNFLSYFILSGEDDRPTK